MSSSIGTTTPAAKASDCHRLCLDGLDQRTERGCHERTSRTGGAPGLHCPLSRNGRAAGAGDPSVMSMQPAPEAPPLSRVMMLSTPGAEKTATYYQDLGVAAISASAEDVARLRSLDEVEDVLVNEKRTIPTPVAPRLARVAVRFEDTPTMTLGPAGDRRDQPVHAHRPRRQGGGPRYRHRSRPSGLRRPHPGRQHPLLRRGRGGPGRTRPRHPLLRHRRRTADERRRPALRRRPERRAAPGSNGRRRSGRV